MRRPRTAQCPICTQQVTLGLYGKALPWHRIRNGQKGCSGEGMQIINGEVRW